MTNINDVTEEIQLTNLTLADTTAEHCIVCGNRDWALVREGYDKHRPEYRKAFKLTLCLSCGHIMQNPLPSAEELAQAYSVEYAPYRPAWKQAGWPLWKIFRELTTFRRTRRLRRYARGHKLLEVGCGAGDFLRASHRAGWHVAGVEYSEHLVKMLRSELSFDVRSGELKPGLWSSESFDAVILWSVIEHVIDPATTLATVASYLRPGGTIFLQLPTTSEAQFGRFFSGNWEMDLPRHLNFFDRKSLSALCNKAGIQLTIFRTPFLDTAWCYLTSCTNFANASKSRAVRALKLVLATPVMVLLVPYMAVQAWRGRGTEAFAVAVKN